MGDQVKKRNKMELMEHIDVFLYLVIIDKRYIKIY